MDDCIRCISDKLEIAEDWLDSWENEPNKVLEQQTKRYSRRTENTIEQTRMPRIMQATQQFDV